MISMFLGFAQFLKSIYNARYGTMRPVTAIVSEHFNTQAHFYQVSIRKARKELWDDGITIVT